MGIEEYIYRSFSSKYCKDIFQAVFIPYFRVYQLKSTFITPSQHIPSENQGKRYYIIAGEASGDLHGSNLIRELKSRDSYADIRCWGGDMMQQAGAKLVKHYRELAFMGFTEVIKNLPTILRNIKFCKQDILGYQPDAVILVDYPGFNLRIAKWAKEQGIKVIYYISPQVWAWKQNRVRMMKKCIDKMLVILPFEKDYYKNKWNWEVEYVGHPLVEVVDRFLLSVEKDRLAGIAAGTQTMSIVALLPGSRKQEIAKKLPIMLEVSKHFRGYQFIIAQAPAIEDGFYKKYTAAYDNVSFVKNKTYDLLSKAKAALVTSGTATLETALFGVPEIVCYKGSPVSYQIAKRVIKVKYISLVNLIMNRLTVKELIQEELNDENLKNELLTLLTDEKRIEEIKKDYAALKELLSKGGNASANAAESIFQYLGE